LIGYFSIGNAALYWHMAVEAFLFASPETKCMSAILMKESRLVVLYVIICALYTVEIEHRISTK
jgi:hypothetical protein